MRVPACRCCGRAATELLLDPARQHAWRLMRERAHVAACGLAPSVQTCAVQAQHHLPRRAFVSSRLQQADALHREELPQKHQNWADRSRRQSSMRAAASARDSLLRGVDSEFRDDVARVIDAAQRANDSWQPAVTDFLPPPVVASASAALKQLAGVGAVPWGGYPQAERCRMLVGPEDMLPPAPERGDADFEPAPQLSEAVTTLAVRGNFMFDAADHRDFLGAILGSGIERTRVGDILLTGDRGAQILVVPSLADFLCEALMQVRTVPVETRAISQSELQVPAPRIERRVSVESSMRVDALASAGFRMSRSKMTDLITKGDVRVNWKPVKVSATLASGDIVSCSGKGRLEVGKVNKTVKGKFSVELARWT